MTIELEDRGKALEDEYFRRQEKELIAKMKAKVEAEKCKSSDKTCPKDCEQSALKEVDFENIKIDVCETCGGVWLDAGELNTLISKDEKAEEKSWFSRLLG